MNNYDFQSPEYCPVVPPFEFFNNFGEADVRSNFFQVTFALSVTHFLY